MKTLKMMLAILAVAAAVANPALAATNGKRMILTFKAKTTAAQRAAVLKALGAASVKTIQSTEDRADKFQAVVAEISAASLAGVAAAALPKGKAANAAIMSLIPEVSRNEVVSIEEDYKIKWIEASGVSPAMPSIGSFLDGAALLKANSFKPMADRPEITWGVSRVKAPAAWDYTQGEKVRVAVIDTGIDSSHPDLVSKVDGGYNAITKSEARDAWQDDQGHGTHVAGTIGAAKDGKGVVGVAPKARLYAVKVLDADGSGSLSDVIDGIIWAANNEMQVANMSLGSSMPSDTMQRALRYAKSKGVIVVAAAGNSGGAVGYPGAYPEVIGVSAGDASDKIAGFSSRGPEVDFIAPGVNVVSSAMGGGFANFSGTSMACPHMAGIVALSVAQGWVGMDGPDGVLAQLKKAAKPIAGLSATEQGFGMVDASKLVR